MAGCPGAAAGYSPTPIFGPGIDGAAYATGMIFPAPGCWRIQGAAGDQTLEAIIYVYP